MSRSTRQRASTFPSLVTEGGRSPREVVAFRDVRRTLRGRRVVLGGPGPVADLLEQVGTHGEVAVPLTNERLEGLELGESRVRPERVREGDDPAQPRDWVVRQGDELVVPLEDLSPIGFLGPWRIIVQRGDRGLQLVLAASVRNKGLLEDPDALGDLVGVPQGAVLLGRA